MNTQHFMPRWDGRNRNFFIKEKLANGQTVIMSFELECQTDDTDYWNIAMCVVSKRKHIDKVFESRATTGGDPVATFSVVRKMFRALEEKILQCRSRNNFIYCTWLDGKRRDVYYRFLSRLGYRYGKLEGAKVIFKLYPRRDAN